MASATVNPNPPSISLTIESIPTVDLRLLTQSELTSLSLCSSTAFDLRRYDDLVIPKIDRSFFNESAGSRKQTYSRLRLAPRNSNPNFSPNPNPNPNPTLLHSSSERAENSRIVSIFKSLFQCKDSEVNSCASDYNVSGYDVSARDERQLVDVSELALVPVSVEYCDNVPVSLQGESILVEGNRKRKRGRKPKSEINNTNEDEFDPSLAMVVVEEEGNRKRKRGRKPKSETNTPTIESYNDDEFDPSSSSLAMVVVEEEGDRKRKRGRKPKSEVASTLESYNEDEFDPSLAMVVVEEEGMVEVEVKEEKEENWEEREKELMNREGVAVDLAELAKKEDPYGEELRRRTEGKAAAEELLEFVRDLEGEWGSRRKKRKIVDANLFGDALPNGWKVLIAIKKKLGRAWVFCRRYISPNGRYFVSCKEVSSYLFSLNGLQESQAQDLENSMVETLASENVADIRTKNDDTALPTFALASQSCDLESHQMQLCISEAPEPAMQLILSKDVHLGDVQPASALKCHKCSSPFTEKDELLNHLLSCHKRKRRKSSLPVDDDILMKDGKYECQFCNKIFVERNSYFGHVGMHVKNYVKSRGGTPGLVSKQNSSDVGPVGEAPVTAPDTLETVEHTSASRELNSSSLDIEIKASNSERHVVSCTGDPNNASLHVELIPTQTDKTSAGETSGEQIQMEVDDASDFSAGKADYSSGSDKVLYNNKKDLYDRTLELDATECVASKVSRSAPAFVDNPETSSHSDDKKVDMGEEVNFVAGNSMKDEGLAYGNGLRTDHKENLSSSQICADRSLESEAVEPNFFDEGLKVAGNDQLLDGCDGGHLAFGMNAEGNVQHAGKLEDYSAVPEAEEYSCCVTANKKEHMGSPFTDSKLERGSETRNFTASGGQPTIGMQTNDAQDFVGLMDETEVDLCNFDNTEVRFDSEKCIIQSRHSNLSKDSGSNYFRNETQTDSHIEMLQATGTGGFQTEQTCSSENSLRDFSNREAEERKSDQLESNLFFTSERTDVHLDSNDMTNNGQNKNNVSDTLGVFNSFVEEKQEQVPRNMLSGLSMNDQSHEGDVNNVMNVSSTTTNMQLPELDKLESPRANNKLMFDFGSMTDMNARFLSSVQHETVSEASAFQLWGQQTCGLEDNQSKVYGGARAVAQQERASNNNSLNLVGLQQPSHAGYNLNEVGMSKQRYVQQHNETGVFSRNNEARSEDFSHGNTLSLCGFQQQCDAGYNLNKPCVNQQSYSIQHTQGGAYSTSDEARQERVSYGNSLSLASVQQACDSSYGISKECVQQTCDPGYSMNKGYLDTVQGMSKIDELGPTRDRDLMIGFGSGGQRSDQVTATDFLWRSSEGNILPGGLVDSSSSQGQSSGSFQAFDFLSDKSGNGLYASNEKINNMSGYEGLRSTVEPTEFSFMTNQESNAQLQHPKVLQYNTGMDQGFGSSVWNPRPTSLPNMMTGNFVSTLCVWCGNQFHQDSLSCEMQAGSIGFLCPTCKARMSGQFL